MYMNSAKKNVIKYKSESGREYILSFYKSAYRNNGRLYVGCMYEETWGPLPFCNITVNLTEENAPEGNYGFIDTNNVSQDLFELMIDNGWIELVGVFGTSGFCTHPLVKFSDDFVNGLDEQ